MFRTLRVKNGWPSHTFIFDIFLDLINGGGGIALYSDVYSKVTTVTVNTTSSTFMNYSRRK